MTPADLFRGRDPRAAALRQYAANFDWFAEAEQGYRSTLPDLAREVGATAFLFLRAYGAELHDPTPRGRSNLFCCAQCLVYRALPAEVKPPLALESIQ